jgi:ring-1,2-phenylacetyl-CoA epoxidase subunit PaaD
MVSAPVHPAGLSVGEAWEVLGRVADPEIPVISVTELGIVREVRELGDALEVVVTPTYSGCPATELIESSISEALHAAGAAWTTDWIAPPAKDKLTRYGIAPPHVCGQSAGPLAEKPIVFLARAIPCPRCGSSDTERLSQFGATACKALYRCRACREPFEYFKPL